VLQVFGLWFQDEGSRLGVRRNGNRVPIMRGRELGFSVYGASDLGLRARSEGSKSDVLI
jgi:hypothetical protein